VDHDERGSAAEGNMVDDVDHVAASGGMNDGIAAGTSGEGGGGRGVMIDVRFTTADMSVTHTTRHK